MATEGGYTTILLERVNGVAKITLNRPHVLNAMNPKMGEELNDALKVVAEDPKARAVLITGAGRAFCAGGDIKEDLTPLSRKTPMELREYLARNQMITRRIAEMEKPVVAGVNGVAVGAGCDIALACDIRIASDEAKFGEFYIRRGLIPDLGGIYYLPRLIGLGRAKLLVFTGDLIGASEAERMGLVDVVIPKDQFEEAVNKLVSRLASGPTKAIAMAKLALNRSLHMDLESSLDYVTGLMAMLVQTRDHQEGIKAFLEKREPIYEGR